MSLEPNRQGVVNGTEKILADEVSTPVEPHPMKNLIDRSVPGRAFAGVVMSGLTLALIVAGVGYKVIDPRLLLKLMLPVALIAIVLVTVYSPSAWAAWGRLCLSMGSSALRWRWPASKFEDSYSGPRIRGTSTPSIRGSVGGSSTRSGLPPLILSAQ